MALAGVLLLLTIFGQRVFPVGATSAVPEPGAWLLLAVGIAGIAGLARRRRTSRGD